VPPEPISFTRACGFGDNAAPIAARCRARSHVSAVDAVMGEDLGPISSLDAAAGQARNHSLVASVSAAIKS